MTEAELHEGLIRRDQEALARLIDTFGASVYALVLRILSGAGTGQDVEECCSDVFYESWEKADQYQPGRAALRTWLLMIAKYKALDYRRKLLSRQGLISGQIEEKDVTDRSPVPEMAVLASEQRNRVLDALAALSPQDKELVYRRYFLNESIDQLAADLGLTRQAVDNRLWRARKGLRSLLEENWRKEEP